MEKTPEGDCTSPETIGVVAEQGLEQARQRRAGAVEHAVRTEDDDAAGRQVALGQRPEVDDRVGDPQLPEDQAAQPDDEQDDSVCTRQKGSLYQSHSCPLLSMTSQQAMISASSPRPM